MHDFFPKRPEAKPTIYAFSQSGKEYEGLLKVGYTTRSAAVRVAEIFGIKQPNEVKPYRIVVEESAVRGDGSAFDDHAVHRALESRGAEHAGGEWYRCTEADVRAAIVAVMHRTENAAGRTATFPLRDEQREAVEKTRGYLMRFRSDPGNRGLTPHFLWNCKMRFGKTFAAYHLALAMGWRRVLVLTFKPAVENAWRDDLLTHCDFEGWQFVSPDGELSLSDAKRTGRPIVCFGSFQDYLGRNAKTGGIKAKNEEVHLTPWDCVILDEYHFGAWSEKARSLFDDDASAATDDETEASPQQEAFDEDIMPITTDAYLYLSGTPFRALAAGEFIEEQIFNWTYSDEQRKKACYADDDDTNPYAMLPRMVMLTYRMPDAIRAVASGGEMNEFDLNVFFEAKGEGSNARFTHEDEVQKWLDLIRGSYRETIVASLKQRDARPPMPFSHAPLLQVLSHTFWFLPSVASCYAMSNLLKARQNVFYHDYRIIVAAGAEAGIGADALDYTLRQMGDPLRTKSITLSCGKLTTGVTVRQWTGIFMLRNSSSPETYFQAAFRVQSPWTVRNPDGLSPNKTEVMKRECYVFDFAPNRALRQLANYACALNIDESNAERSVADFINFLPVLAYDGSSMKQIDAGGILDMAMSGTTSTLLAKRWQSAMLVNVDNATLRRLFDNAEAMQALMRIEGFGNLHENIAVIINRSEEVKRMKRDNDALGKKEKKQLSEAEKEYKSKRKEIQEKLIKFATRVPVFMYLTDYRERTLEDVITKLEPGLFRKVTGLTTSDFRLLVSLGLFDKTIMNDAVRQFKAYEDASLEYIGINRHAAATRIGLFDTTISKAPRTFVNEGGEEKE